MPSSLPSAILPTTRTGHILAATILCVPTWAAAAAPPTRPAARPPTQPAAAARVVYLIDMSGSMTGVWPTALVEVAKSLDALGPQARFAIVTAHDKGPVPMPSGWLEPTDANKSAAWGSLRGKQPQGTNYKFEEAAAAVARPAPRPVTFVSDGTPNEGVEQFAEPLRAAQRAGQFTASTSLAFADGAEPGENMMAIARGFRGQAPGTPMKGDGLLDPAQPLPQARPRGAPVLTPKK